MAYEELGVSGKDKRLLYKATKDHRKLSYAEREKAKVLLREAQEELEAKIANAKTANPYLFYEPTTGKISGERRDFLEKFLKAEDIPQRLIGQLDCHKSLSNIRGFSGGNRSGKTTAGIIEIFIQITGALPISLQGVYPSERLTKRKGPQHWRIVSVDFDNGIHKTILPALRQWAPREFLMDGSFDKSYVAGMRTLRLVDKGQLIGTIELMSNKQEVGDFQGPERHGVMYDEEPREDIRKENLLRMATTGVQEIYCMTPTNGLSWTFDKLFSPQADEKGNRIDWFQITSVSNPRTSLVSLKEILQDLDSYEETKMRILGEYISLSGLVYGKTFDPRLHVIEPFDTGCTCGTRSRDHQQSCPYWQYMGFVGVDAHMVKESCMSMCFIDADDNFFVDTCYKRGVDTDQLKRDYHRLTERKRIDWAVFDPSNDSTITAFRGMNIFKQCTTGPNRIARAFKGDKYAGSIAAGVSEVKKRLKVHPISNKPRFFIMNRPENQELIRSMKIMQRDSWSNEDVRGQKDKILEGVHDHHAAMRYILQNRLRWKGLEMYQPQPMFKDEVQAIL